MPAVTRVDECTKADTGVGAAIAAGSQALKGSCALLVLAATKINKTTRLFGLNIEADSNGKDKEGQILRPPKDTRIKPSPTRLEIPVNKPALRDLVLL